jgi:tetratricopeptide (TPR) repeat protein
MVFPTFVLAQAVNVQDAHRISAAASADTRANAGKLFADAFKRLQGNEFQAAIDTYAKGLALDPANASARYFYGLALDGLGNRAAARAQYELILLLAPTSEVGNIARGILLEYDEKVSDTIEGCW